MKTVWLTEFFKSSTAQRASELRLAIEANLHNQHLQDCRVFHEAQPAAGLPEWLTTKRNVRLCEIPARFRFRDFLEGARDEHSVYVLTNADIRLDSSASMFRHVRAGELWALSRWENGVRPGFLDRSTQDTWAVRGGAFGEELLRCCEFTLGLPGCDNAFAGRIKDVGFRVLNYAFSVRTDHLHDSGQRTYASDMTVPRPYFYPHPSNAPLWLRLKDFIERKFFRSVRMEQKPPQVEGAA